MGKRVAKYALIFYMLFMFIPVERVQAETDMTTGTQMSIYAMYLGDEKKGDSVLIESRGHYLLVDIGSSSQTSFIGAQLKKLGAEHVDVLFSHLHGDHIGGSDENTTEGLEQLRSMGITIDTLYVPSEDIAPLSERFAGRHAKLQDFAVQGGCGEIITLNVGDEVSFGDVKGRVIGPVNAGEHSPDLYTQYEDDEDRYIAYENDSSLAMIFTCGNTRYFTAGDCYSRSAKELVETYGSGLKCQIMKLCHHGIGTGNSADLLAAVRPSFSFAPNSGIYNKKEDTGRWRTYTATKRASKYGMPYMIGQEKKTIIYRVVNDKITLYHGTSISEKNKMTGWQYLYGADGANRDHDMYYLDSSCKPVKGVKKIDGHYFYFTAGGQMSYGSYSSNGTYLGWKTYTNGQRYYTLSANKKYAYMGYGFTTVGGAPVYFDQNGYQVVSESEDELSVKKIGNAYYAVNYEGELTVDQWEVINDKLCYFDSTGKMIRNCQYMVDGEYYLFDAQGAMIEGKYHTEFVDFRSKTYAVRADGTVVTNKCARIGGEKYYMDRKGVVQKNKLIKIGQKKYYFGKNGKMVRNKNFIYKGKKYHSNAGGAVSPVKKKAVSKKASSKKVEKK